VTQDDDRRRHQVMQRIAVPMFGGMISSTILTRIIILVFSVYALIKWFGLPREPNAALKIDQGISARNRCDVGSSDRSLGL
jgi:hypothetical protein